MKLIETKQLAYHHSITHILTVHSIDMEGYHKTRQVGGQYQSAWLIRVCGAELASCQEQSNATSPVLPQKNEQGN